MSEAKYKVGDVVVSVCHPKPRAITRVLTCYAFADGTGMYCESELTPYVRPLAVGDRVRHTRYQDCDGKPWEGTIIDTMGPMAVVRHSDSFSVFALADLERIPEEAGK